MKIDKEFENLPEKSKQSLADSLAKKVVNNPVLAYRLNQIVDYANTHELTGDDVKEMFTCGILERAILVKV